MPNIKEVVDRINSVTSTQQITKAMKMVAAAKLNKVQQRVLAMRPYAAKLTAILDHVTTSTDQEFAQQYVADRPVDKLLLVVLGSDRGLCGSSNTHVFKKALGYLQQEVDTLSPSQVSILPVGKKTQTFFGKRDFQLITDYVTLSHDLSYKHASQAATALTNAFLQHTYDRIVLVYNKFQSAATQIPQAMQWLPIVKPSTAPSSTEAAVDYIYEPSQEGLIEALVPQSLQIQFYQTLLEASASEHGARMTTMSQATDNADDLLQGLRLTYNRNRQAVITREISEIVAGANALAG